MTAASLRTLSAVVDEIVVAFDMRIDPHELGPPEGIGRFWSAHPSIEVLGVVPIGKGLLVGTIHAT